MDDSPRGGSGEESLEGLRRALRGGAGTRRRSVSMNVPWMGRTVSTRSEDRLEVQVHETLPNKSEGPGHLLQPGDWVVTKNFQREKNLEPRWKGPVQVLLATRTAVRVTKRKNWVHATHCKKVPTSLAQQLQSKDSAIVHHALKDERGERYYASVDELLFADQTTEGRERYNLRPRIKQ